MKLGRYTVFTCLLTLTYHLCVFSQEQDKNAFSYELNYTGDILANLNGGITTGHTYLGMANLSISFNTKKAGLWKGGEFFINGANTHGGEPSANIIGDFQTVSNIEAGELTYLHEFWFKQTFGQHSVTIGLQDLNANFAASGFGGMFINSSFGIHSTIADNVPSPIFPLTRPGLEIQLGLSESFRLKAAVFDGLLSDYQNNEYNTNWSLKTADGILFISEIEFSTSLKNNPGSYKIGYYQHENAINSNEQTSDNLINRGFYLVADQLLTKHITRDGGLGFFGQVSYSNPNKNNHFAYFGVGLHYCGISNNRCNDEVGIGLAHSRFKSSFNGNETAIELSYKAQLGEHFFIQPDLQYIINPAGTEEVIANAFVGILRFGLNF